MKSIVCSLHFFINNCNKLKGTTLPQNLVFDNLGKKKPGKLGILNKKPGQTRNFKQL